MRFKIVLSIAVFITGLISCKQGGDNTDKESGKNGYTAIGKNITHADILEPMDAIIQYEIMAVGDTIPSKISGKVTSVCQTKGCWMTLDLGDDQEVMVKFKDYAFFVPKDIVGKQAVVEGLAFIKDMSVEEQQHYAEDEGKTSDEIERILQPKRTLFFQAEGVLIKE